MCIVDYIFTMFTYFILPDIDLGHITQVNRMSRYRRVLAIGGKQRILGLDMVCIETILLYLDSL